jgi:hypothetical protein
VNYLKTSTGLAITVVNIKLGAFKTSNTVQYWVVDGDAVGWRGSMNNGDTCLEDSPWSRGANLEAEKSLESRGISTWENHREAQPRTQA